ncbi:MAG: FAD-dependent oxidoreductase [Pseudomonadota bacterium]
MGLSFDRFTHRAVYADFEKPRRFDQNMVVIGGGSAGLVTSYIAAAIKAGVTLIERHRMGGDCLYTGCVPSKTLLRSAKFVHDASRSQELGIRSATVDFDFGDLMDRVRQVIATIEPHDSPERYEGLGVRCVSGTATVESPWQVRVDDRVITARSIVLATGARPFVPPIPGIEDAPMLTSDTLWDLREQPRRLVVLGGGPIGCEMTQAFARLGSEVTLVEMMDRIMSVEDEDAGELVADALTADGVTLLTGHRATAVEREGDDWVLRAEAGDETVSIPFDHILVAVGRRANTSGLGLEDLGIETNPNGTIQVNEFLQTRFPNVLACGDVISPWQFTHSAAHEAYYAAVNGLFGDIFKQAVDYSTLPWTTFTDPEVARIGLNEQEARDQGIAVEVTRHELTGLDRALAEEEAKGFVKILTPPGKDKILGATIVGPHAGELIAELVLARKHGLGLNKILGTVHVYPTLSEANKFAAGNWRKAHQPTGALKWLERIHRWRR